MRAKGNGAPAVCALNLLLCQSGEAPYSRLKGLDPEITDLPGGEYEAALRAAIDWQLKTYEPRADGHASRFAATAAGIMRHRAHIETGGQT